MAEPLRVLIVDDSEDDALLMVRQLELGGFDVDFRRVDTSEAMNEALLAQTWDVILCDHVMPKFSTPAALEILREKAFDIPFIIVSGGISAELAVTLMRAGAHDWISKGDLSRLVPAIERELRDAKARVERRGAEEALRESEKQYKLLVDGAAEAIVVAQDGMIKLANRMTGILTGFSEQELLGKPFAFFIHPDDRAIMDKRHQRRLKGESLPARYDFRVLAKDGSTKWAHISAVVIAWEGRPATLNLLTDVTERKEAEEALAKRTEDAEDAKVRARAYFDFLAHDISNLLSPVMAYAEFISLDAETPKPSKIKADKIVNQAHRASSFILSLRRLEDAELMSEERMESRELGEIMDEAVMRVKGEYGDKKISATVVHAAEQVMFKGGKHLESIVVGVLENTVATADRDELALEVKATIEGDKDHRFLRLELTDDGPGISDATKECFMVSEDPRKRFDAGISRGVASTLLISSAIVSSLGGELWIEDRIPGDCSKGSRILIKFPQEGFFGT